MTGPTRGVLLVDVGTPAELKRESVQEYLNEFLGDPFVIRGPRWVRDILFRRIIIPLRSSRSLEKYRRIWTPEGAPLRVEAQRVSQLLETQLNQQASSSKWLVRYAFHYGGPTIESALDQLKESGVEELLVLPLYPQWALSTRGGLEERLKQLKVYRSEQTDGYGFAKVTVAPVFFEVDGFSQAQSELLKQHLPKIINDEVAVVFSFHGLPESHITAVTPECKRCLRRGAECRPNAHVKPYCYRHQCFETARQIGVKSSLFHWDVAFQSRLGPAKWLEPSLLEVTDQLLEQGVKTMVVQCPSFVFDCLETLEEVGMELKEHFLKNGGREFILVPALNRSELWMKTLQTMILDSLGG